MASLWRSSVARVATVSAVVGITLSAAVTASINKNNPDANANNGYIRTWSASGSQVGGMHTNGNLAISGSFLQNGSALYADGSTMSGIILTQRRVAWSDLATNATTGSILFNPMAGGQFTEFYVEMDDAASSGVTVDVSVGGSSIFATTIVTDERETTSATAATPYVLGDSRFSKYDKVLLTVSACGSDLSADGVTCPKGLTINWTESGSTFAR